MAPSAEEAVHHMVELPSTPDDRRDEETTAMCEEGRLRSPSGDGRHPTSTDVTPLVEEICTDEETSEPTASMEVGLAPTDVGLADMEVRPEDASRFDICDCLQ